MVDTVLSSRTKLTADVAVIGAGSGGLSVASGAAQLGLNVVLFEGDEMGGDCLNYGCVPSKALLATSNTLQVIKDAEKLGIEVATPKANWAAVKAHLQSVIAEIAPVDSQERFEGLGVKVIREVAHFTSPSSLASESYEVTARRIVIAAGSVPLIPGVEGLASRPFWTNETIFDMPDLPEHLIVLGGGPIGLEMAQAFHRLGSNVTVVEMGQPLRRSDPVHAAQLVSLMREEGITILDHHKAIEVKGGQNDLTLIAEGPDGPVEIHGTDLLVAVGRTPALDLLELDRGEVDSDRNGIVTKPNLRSVSNPNVWAVGDIAGRGQFTHLAGWHASIFVQAALMKLPSKAVTDQLPAVTFVDPEIGQIGLTEAEAREKHGDSVETVEFPFDEIDRAITDRQKTGSLRLVIRKNGKILGASVLGQAGGEILQILSLAMANKLTMRDLTKYMSPYPTRAEIVKRAASKHFQPKVFGPMAKKLVGILQRIP
ncbi:MAG: dihydrolipoamide dehydrogenase [Ponticaulis sp.]|nr:dihydrolipoamide dehydrogenase [Ponticaulis sp.]|tara:strand:- start:33137 stop:34588 length:1452 start_codon:yes stop_codon:yes gene_type:complete